MTESEFSTFDTDLSEHPALPKRGDVIAGKYVVEGMLGSGGMGAVYRVTHRVTGRGFAVKWLLPQLTSGPDTVQRFIREAQVAGRVDHANIVEVYDVGQEGKSFYMVMELLMGEALSQRMAAAQNMAVAELCQIMIPVTRGLAAAHRAGVIHRDLKPDNIFLCKLDTGEQLPKVLDFGISKMSQLTSEANSAITREGTVMGTPHYMSPEQVRAVGVDARTDVYALGVIMYEMLSAALPFPGENLADVLVKIMTETPTALRTLAPQAPAELIAIVERAMARDPAQRFDSVADLGNALTPFANSSAIQPTSSQLGAAKARVPGPPTPLATESGQSVTTQPMLTGAAWPQKQRAWVAGVGAGALVLALAAWALTRSSAPAPSTAAAHHGPVVSPAQPAAAGADRPGVATDLETPKAGSEELPALNTKLIDAPAAVADAPIVMEPQPDSQRPTSDASLTQPSKLAAPPPSLTPPAAVRIRPVPANANGQSGQSPRRPDEPSKPKGHNRVPRLEPSDF